MKKLLLTIVLLAAQYYLLAQESTHNLDFEIQENNTAKGWKDFGQGNFKTAFNVENAKSGKLAATIESTEEGGQFWANGYTIPVTFGGKKIKLTGYVKTENVTDGYGGLWMRIDPEVGFDNMNNRGIKGTTDWTKYEIELDLRPDQAKSIVVGGILIGKGKIWVDDLQVTIDGKSLENAPERKLDKAQSDQEFDTGSKVVLSNLSVQQVENATILGKVWGFLKYHHRSIASGNHNWDYELFRVMQPIINASSSSERDALILTWIAKYGDIPICQKCDRKIEPTPQKPDHAWMKNTSISSSLQEKLNYIYKNRHQGKQYYIGTYPGVGNPDFKNENGYAEMPYPDAGFRLLCLYRYWNMIHYFFPNRDITDKDWNSVLKEYVPRFVNAKDELAYEIAALQLIGDIQDTHANLWGGGDKFRESKGKFYPPVHLRFFENKLVVTDFYNPELKESTRLEVGDVITKIDGVAVSEIVKNKVPYYPASNYPSQLRDIAGDILRSHSEAIEITVNRGTSNTTQKLNLYQRSSLNMYGWYPKPEGKSYKMLDNNIGYVTLANIEKDDPEQIAKKFLNCKGVIVDIRNYPSSFVVFSLGQFFAPRGTEFVQFTTANLNHPGEFQYGKNLMVGAGTIAKNKFEGKVVILVNELSQSQAEYTAMAFRAAPNATVVGSTTAGADGNVSTILLPGGLRTMISGIGVFYPDGSPTQRVGIIPDVVVEPTIEGIRQGRDELMEKAIELINNFKK